MFLDRDVWSNPVPIRKVRAEGRWPEGSGPQGLRGTGGQDWRGRRVATWLQRLERCQRERTFGESWGTP